MTPPPLPEIVRPDRITAEMVRLASGDPACPPAAHHIAANLNAMLAFGYCSRCGLCPDGCAREGCRPAAKALPKALPKVAILGDLFGPDDEMDFRRKFAVQFLASWAAVHFNDCCARGAQESLEKPPVEDAYYLSGMAWAHWCDNIWWSSGPAAEPEPVEPVPPPPEIHYYVEGAEIHYYVEGVKLPSASEVNTVRAALTLYRDRMVDLHIADPGRGCDKASKAAADILERLGR